jgi:hypothetical protein
LLKSERVESVDWGRRRKEEEEEARRETMRAEREQLAMWREDLQSGRIEEAAHKALFSQRNYKPRLSTCSEMHLFFRIDLPPVPSTYTQLTPLKNTPENRLSKNDPAIALPALQALPRRKTTTKKITISVTFHLQPAQPKPPQPPSPPQPPAHFPQFHP